jgi:hypothetical protein
MEEDKAGGEGSLVTSSEEEEEEELGRESSRTSYEDEEMCVPNQPTVMCQKYPNAELGPPRQHVDPKLCKAVNIAIHV